MERQGTEGPRKTESTRDIGAGETVGSRHGQSTGEVEKTKRDVQSGTGNAMEAVREVVEAEGKGEKNEGRSKSDGDTAMDAVREIVEKE